MDVFAEAHPMMQLETGAQQAKLHTATSSDAAALAELYQIAWSDPGENEARVQEWLGDGGVLSFVCNGTFVSALRWREASYGWEVGRLATLPEYRGQGFGRWLTTRLEALAIQHNIPELRLTLTDTQTELLPYYTRMGYHAAASDAPLALSKQVGGVWQRQG